MEKERQSKEGTMRVSCATSTLVAKIECPRLTVTVREVVKGGSTYKSVRSRKLHAPGTNACATVNVPTPDDEREHDPDRPCRSKDMARTTSSRGGTCPAFCNSLWGILSRTRQRGNWDQRAAREASRSGSLERWMRTATVPGIPCQVKTQF
jgi:hypothetical protein